MTFPRLLLICVALLWVPSGVFLGQRCYREMRDLEGRKPFPALLLSIVYGVVQPPLRAVKAVYYIVSGGFSKKK